MKKIAIISPGYLPIPAVKGGAVEQLVTNIIDNNENDEQFNIDVFSIDDASLQNKKYNNSNLKLIKVFWYEKIIEKVLNKFFSILNISYEYSFYCNKSIRIMKCQKYDYILIENNMYNFKKVHKKYKRKSKFIFHLHNDIGKRDKPFSLCYYIEKNASLILTCSNFLTKKFINYTNSSKTFTLNNAVDLNSFYFDEKEKKIIRKKYQIENNDFVFGYIGRISPEKGLLELIKAFKKIKFTNDIKLLIIGDLSHKNNYVKKILEITSTNSENIIFAGNIKNEEIYKYISSVNCVIIPTICEEAFGVVALETMNCSRPLIITDSGGLVEIVDKKCALIAERDDIINNLYLQMKYLLENKNICLKMGENAKKRIEMNSDYDYKQYFSNFCNYIKKVDD